MTVMYHGSVEVNHSEVILLIPQALTMAAIFATTFHRLAHFEELRRGYHLISRGCFYDKKFENYVMYLIDGDTLQECLDKYDDVQSTSSP